MKKAIVLGGNGFLGSFLVKELCERNFQVIIISRTKKNFDTLKTLGFPGQIIWKQEDVLKESFIFNINFTEFECIINLIGIGEEKKRNSYYKIHVDLPFKLASATKKAGCKFFHVSAFTPKEGKNSKYVKTKQEGEKKVLEINKNAIIIRPSVMIGEGGSLIQTFEKIINYSPLVPLVLGGKNKIQPVFAGDVAKFIVLANEKYSQFSGKSYNLTGDETILFKDFIERIMGFMNKKRYFINMPFFIFSIILRINSILPNFLKFKTTLTADIAALSKLEMESKKTDLTLLVQSPKSVDDVLSLVLAKYKLYD